MLTLLLSLAHADDPHAIARIYDLQRSGRPDEARQEAGKLVQADPTDLGAQLTYLLQHTMEGARAAKAQVATYTAWLSEKPDDLARHAELALAMGIAAGDGRSYDGLPAGPGPWCDAVLAELVALPEAPDVRARALKLRINIEDRCGRDGAADQAAMIALAETSDIAKPLAVWYRFIDGVDEADVAALGAMLALQPWRISDFTSVWGDKATGPGLEHARSLLKDAAAKNATSSDPVLVSSALYVFLADHDVAAGSAAGKHLREIDPKRTWIPTPSAAGAAPPPPPPAALGDPAATLAALDARKDKQGKYDKLPWTLQRADALLALHRDAEALDALHRAYWLDPGIGSNLRFAREAVRQGAQLRAAKNAADVAVDDLSGISGGYNGGWESRRAALAEAYAVRAAIFHGLGKDRKAAKDASQSLVLQDTPGATVLLGVAFAAKGWAGAFDILSRGLAAGGSGDATLDAEANAALARLWPAQNLWTPGGLEGWLTALKSVPDQAPASETAGERAGEAFPNLTLTLGGAQKSLADLPGPLVVDLWATWCGPCREALPTFDQVARTHPGTTFVAVSVDDTAAKADDYLSKSTPAFRAAWAGPDAMKTAGVSGIPTTFILDADHRIVDVLHGWGPGDTALEDRLGKLATHP